MLMRWFVSYALFGLPQAAAPIAFALMALQLTGDANDGAAVVVAMVAAQIAGAVPITRLGRSMDAVRFLKLLIACRALALGAIAVIAACQLDFTLIIGAGAIAGLVNGAAYGYLRSILNHVVEPSGLLRALGIGATLNEIMFVTGPVLASAMGAISPTVALGSIAILSIIPAILVPTVREFQLRPASGGSGAYLTPPVLVWLFCSFAGSGAVAAIEVGSVSLALQFGLFPSYGVIFTVALCVASVSGGIWVSSRKKVAARSTISAFLGTMALGTGLIALAPSVYGAAIGCILVGSVMAPLSTYYSIVLDGLVSSEKRTEMFALLRTAGSLGAIVASACLAWTSVHSALILVMVFLVAACGLTAGGSIYRPSFFKDER